MEKLASQHDGHETDHSPELQKHYICLCGYTILLIFIIWLPLYLNNPARS